MKCFFCHNEITDQFTIGNSNITHLYCEQCQTKYAYNNRKQSVLYYRIFGCHKDKKYVAHFNLDRQDFYLGDVSKSEVAKIIFQLDFLPIGITPDTLPNKLPTYLIFS